MEPDTNPPAGDSARASDRASDPGAPPPPPGLRAQIAATVEAVKRLLSAHIELAKAELGEVVDEVKKMAALIGAAIGLLVMMGLLLSIGLVLWLGEWLFGSIGWGFLLGSLLYLDLAVTLVLVALGVGFDRVVAPLGVAVALGIAVAAVLGIVLGLAWQPAIAIGLLILLLGWLVAEGLAVKDGGIDGEALKDRFMPSQTIDTTKETIEWVRERTPLGRKS